MLPEGLSSGCGSSFAVPGEDLQVKDEDRVHHGHHEQSDKGRHGQSADLGVAERLPERAAVHGEREQRDHGRQDGDHDRDAGG